MSSIMVHRRTVALSESKAQRALVRNGGNVVFTPTRWEYSPADEVDDGVRLCHLAACEREFPKPAYRSGESTVYCSPECRTIAYQDRRRAKAHRDGWPGRGAA